MRTVFWTDAATVGKTRATATALFFFLGMSGCEGKDSIRRVRLWALAPPEVTPLHEEDEAPLRFAVALMISPQEGFDKYSELAEYLGRKLRRPVRLILRRSSSEISDLVRTRQADVASLCSYEYIRGRKDFGLEALAVPRVRGRILHPSYLIVPVEDEVVTPGESGSGVFASAEPSCSPDGPTLVSGKSRQPEAFSKRQLVVHGHDRAIRAVAEGQVDEAVVDGAVYEQMALSRAEDIGKTKIVEQSAPYGTPPIAIHPRTNLLLKRRLQDVFLAMHQDEEGRSILQKLAVDRFVPPRSGMGASASRPAVGMP